MSLEYRLPKIEADSAAVVDTILAADTALATGVLTLKNEAGTDVIDVKISDITGWKYDAFAAGTANVIDIDLTGVSLIANNMYSLSIKLPYAVNFFRGGAHATSDARESDAVYVTRTYKVPTDATPTATELADAFALRINGDLEAKFSATAAVGVISVTADSAEGGAFIVDISNLSGATVADTAAWVSPVGSVSEVLDQMGDASLVVAAGYNRYVIEYNKGIRHNAVKGLKVLKPSKFVYYIDKDDAGAAAGVILLTSILDGSYATVADYLGAPNV
jgi:hypothetical protein